MTKNVKALKEINPTDFWKNEDETNQWLISKEGIKALNEATGMNLTEPTAKTKCYDSKLECDIVCKNGIETVVIENQLTNSNHDHIGKVLTYANNLKADCIVLIACGIRKEHISLIETLNRTSDFRIYVLSMINYVLDGHISVRFDVVVKPCAKKVKKSAKVKKTELARLKFWRVLRSEIKKKTKFYARKVSNKNYYKIWISDNRCYFRITQCYKWHYIGVELYIIDDTYLFEYLYSHKEEIEMELKNIPPKFYIFLVFPYQTLQWSK